MIYRHRGVRAQRFHIEEPDKVRPDESEGQ